MRIAILFLIACSAAAQELPSELLERKTLDRIRGVAQSMDGVMGVYAIDLTNGKTLALNADTVFPTASSIKVFVMAEMFRQARAGKFKLSDEVTLQPAESVGGSGHLQIQLRHGPVKLTVLDLITAMIETSDNTATNKCIAMAGLEEINRLIATFRLRNTRLQRRMLDTQAARRDAENISTPAEMAQIMEMIYHGKVVDQGTSNEMVRILKLVDADIVKAVPSGVEVAAKPGELTGVRCEAAIVYHPKRPFAIAVMSTFLTAGENPVGTIAHIVYEHFDRLAHSNRYGNRVE